MKCWVELIIAFLIAPVIFAVAVSDIDTWLMPSLFCAGIICLLLLLKDKEFKRKKLFHMQEVSTHFISALKLFLPIAILFSSGIYLFAPDIFLFLPLQDPNFWLITLLVYPIVSVIPQELIFRTFFFHRYRKLFPSKHLRVFSSSFFFGLAHIVYGNWIAVVVSWFAGVVFGYRYTSSKSTLIVVIEHTVWGSFAFTIGLGVFLV
ncbi:MAG: CPBP family intramembrane glutamic endopeptidase, partial [Pseudomonadota bacterium]